VIANAGLDDAAWALLSEAAHVYRDSPRSAVWLRHHLDRLGEPLRLAVTGPRRSGRSTLVNALVGQEVAPVDTDGGPPALAWYQDGPAARVTVYPAQSPAYELPPPPPGRRPRVPTGEGDVDEIVVVCPTRALRRTHLADTSPVGPAGDPAATAAAERVLREADALLYLTPRLREEDLRFLRLAGDTRLPGAAGVHVITVLTRADETGGGRIDALVAAKQAARRRRRDPRLAALCQDVVAASPLLAYAARGLTVDEFAGLGALAGVARAELEPHLLSTDRFTAPGFPVPVDAAMRRALLHRLGLLGVRLASTLVRTGCRERGDLADRLVRHSGLAELQESVAEHFLARRPALKARSALLALAVVLRADPLPAAAHLAAELERLVAGAHEFREMRLLAALRARRVRLPDELAGQARRLAGGQGGGPHERLGLPADAPPDDVWTHAAAAVDRWRAERADRRFSRAQQGAAEVVVRSCEGILAGLR
jgi:hypothetical protein